MGAVGCLRLARLDRQCGPEERLQIQELGGVDLTDVTAAIIDDEPESESIVGGPLSSKAAMSV